MLVGGRDCRTQFWKGITHGPFHQSLVSGGQVVSEENICSNCVRTDDRRKVMTKALNLTCLEQSALNPTCLLQVSDFPTHLYLGSLIIGKISV
jgi:hypothetical protein